MDKCCISRLRAPNQIELMKHSNPFRHLLHQGNSCNIVVFFKIFSCYYYDIFKNILLGFFCVWVIGEGGLIFVKYNIIFNTSSFDCF